jgi:hypothetical protein
MTPRARHGFHKNQPNQQESRTLLQRFTRTISFAARRLEQYRNRLSKSAGDGCAQIE